jgi:hypothetical protein
MRYAKSIVGGLAAIALISGSSIAQARSLTLTGCPPGAGGLAGGKQRSRGASLFDDAA